MLVHSSYMLAATNRLLNLTFCVIVVAYQMIYFFSFLSTFASKRGVKKKERRCLSLPNMKHQLFISQACHINKGSILGLGCKEEEQKENQSQDKKNKNLKIDQRGGRREGGAVWAELNLISLWWWGITVPILPTDAIYLYSAPFLVLVLLCYWCSTTPF